jgi:SAM-dependent methyltransferase
MKEFQTIKSWYNQVIATHSLEERKNWYSDIAEAYNQVRPRYPRALIEKAVELARLPNRAALLEIGCGPGVATIEFAQLGFFILGLEPSQPAYQLAKQNCLAYPDVKFENTLFEEWQLEEKRFHAAIAANAWHWIPSEIGYPKVSAALQDGGYLILLWNLSPQLPYQLYQDLERVYQVQSVSQVRYESLEQQEEILHQFGQDIIDSGYFQNLVSEHLPCEVIYSIDDYLLLLTTLSAPYKFLELPKREILFADLRATLEKICPDGVPISYLSAVQVAEKIHL